MKKPAPIVLTKAEAQLVRAALTSAIENEEELIACYTNKHTGKTMDQALTSKTRLFIIRMRRLRARLYQLTKETR